MMESDLGKALIDHIEKIFLELGKGFMYVVSLATKIIIWIWYI